VKTLYWLITGFFFALLIVGVGASTQSSGPINLMGDWTEVGRSYLQWAFLCGVVGAIVGVAGAFLSLRWTVHEPGSATVFLDDVAKYGLRTLLASIAAGVIVFGAVVYTSSLLSDSYSPAERIYLLVRAWPFTAILGAALFGGAVSFAVSTAIFDWGGRYALVPASLFPHRRRR
jgi:hypothetical protein